MQKQKLKPKSSLQKKIIEKFDVSNIGPHPLIGIDEVGRGCIAGPVFAAAVIFLNNECVDQVTDSKLLSEARRAELAEQIHKHHHVSLGFAEVDEIDELNILRASLLAMRRAVEGLAIEVGHLLVDGHQKIPDLHHWPQTAIVKGDLRVAQISAASIVAKVHRDQLMKNYSEKFPGYGFEIHKGYGTEKHRAALVDLGPCVLHRKSFAGVKEFFSKRD